MTEERDETAPPDPAGNGGLGPRLSRRRLLTTIGAGGAAIGLGGGGYALGHELRGDSSPQQSSTAAVEPFYGAHQAGIITPQQNRIQFAAFDVTTTSPQDLVDLLRVWTRAAARMRTGTGRPARRTAAGTTTAASTSSATPPRPTPRCSRSCRWSPFRPAS